MNRWFSLFVVSVLLSANAFSQETEISTSESLLKQCKTAVRWDEGERGNEVSGMACVAYLQGFRHGLVTAQAINGVACIPNEATNGQLMRVVVKYLEDNPERLHLPKAVGAGSAFIRAYPCK